MGTEPAIALRPIGSVDVKAVAHFLHRNLNSRLSVDVWAAAMASPWVGPKPNHGFMLVLGEEVVGANLAFYSRREIGGQTEEFCNLGALCVRQDLRAHAFRLIRAILKQRGYHFTDFSPSGSVIEADRKLGFRDLDTATALSVNLRPPSSKGVEIVDDLRQIGQLLRGPARTLFVDHRETLAARHLLLVRGDEQCYIIFRMDRRKRVRIFASVLYVSDKNLYRVFANTIAGYLLRRHRAIATLAELRVIGGRPKFGHLLRKPRTRLLKSERLGDAEIDYLYSELTCVPW